eukprot:GHVS01026465.1.p1 GENE.GHVS01026465.1~~GHVS01026465.1.p1  ORF type:complete len:352 (-),score=83.61 GHVS01026465.1:626-1681(-)
MSSGAAAGSRSSKFGDFANTLSFYNSSASQPAPLSSSQPPPPPGGLLGGRLTVSLENRPLSYGAVASSASSGHRSDPPNNINATAASSGGVVGMLSGMFAKVSAPGGSSGGSSDGSSNSSNNNGTAAATSSSSSSTINVDDQFGSSGGSNCRDEEEKGLMAGYAHKGLTMAKLGVSSLSVGARDLVNTASGKLQDTSVTFSTQRLLYFGIAAAVGMLFMSLAALMFPLILIAPAKFALMFTMGSISFIVSFGLLKGFKAFLAHVISWERLPFTFTYIASLLLTLYSTLVYPSRILALLFSVVQVGALVSFLISYIPGGTNMLKMIGRGLLAFIKNALKRESGGGGGPGLPV